MKSSWLFGLLGEHIAYTKSPAIFHAIAELTGMEIQFEVFDSPDHQVTGVLDKLSNHEIDGISITIPHKETVWRMLNRPSDEARIIGAVNCIAVENGDLVGHNTDWQGFLKPLIDREVNLINEEVLILGSGGAARAVAYGLLKYARIKTLTIVSRSQANLALFHSMFGVNGILYVDFSNTNAVREQIENAKLVVNATPLGGGNHADGGAIRDILDAMSNGTMYYDLNYNKDNWLIQRAATAGCVTIDGSAMLATQAALSFQLWTGVSVSPDALYRQVFCKEIER